MATKQLGRLLTPIQAAALLRLSPGTLAQWRVQGTGPKFYRVGRSIRYREADIEAMIVEVDDAGPTRILAEDPVVHRRARSDGHTRVRVHV